MKRSVTSSTSKILIGAMLVIGSVAAPPVNAQFECQQEFMAGTWIFHGELWILEREGGPDPYPPPGPFSTTGIQVFDDQGRAVVTRQTISSSMAVQRTDGAAFDFQVAINADCTGQASQTLREDLPPEHPLISQLGLEPGQLVFELDLVCSNGQRVCHATFTEPAAVLLGVLEIERTDPAPSLTTADISSELASIKANIAAVSQRLGIVPQE